MGTQFNYHIGTKILIDLFLPMQRVCFSSKPAECTQFEALRAKLKASADSYGPAGRMLCMPGVNDAYDWVVVQ